MSQREITNLARRKDKHKKFRAARASGSDARFLAWPQTQATILRSLKPGAGLMSPLWRRYIHRCRCGSIPTPHRHSQLLIQLGLILAPQVAAW